MLIFSLRFQLASCNFRFYLIFLVCVFFLVFFFCAFCLFCLFVYQEFVEIGGQVYEKINAVIDLLRGEADKDRTESRHSYRSRLYLYLLPPPPSPPRHRPLEDVGPMVEHG